MYNRQIVQILPSLAQFLRFSFIARPWKIYYSNFGLNLDLTYRDYTLFPWFHLGINK